MSVRPQRLTRRAVLAVVGGALLAGHVSQINRALPGFLVRERTRLLSAPEIPDTVPVTEAHLAQYERKLAELTDAAATAWNRMDESPEFPVEWRGEDIESAQAFGAHIDSKAQNSRTARRALGHVTRTAGALGYARAVTDDLTEADINDGLDARIDAFDRLRAETSYACSNPQAALPYLRYFEEAVWWGRRSASAALPGTDTRVGGEEGTPEWLAARFTNRHESAMRLVDANQYATAARERGGDERPFRESLRRNVADLRAEYRPIADRARSFSEKQSDSTRWPEAVVDGLWQRGYLGFDCFRDAKWRAKEGFDAVAAAKAAAGAIHLGGFQAGVENLRAMDDPPLVSMNRIYRTKRRARGAIHTAVLESPEPFTRYLLSVAAQAVESGDVTLHFRSDGDTDPRTSRTEAYVDYLTAALGAERAPAIAARVVRTS